MINMKTITIKIEHKLTPFHSESFYKMLKAMMEALNKFWSEKSVKHFKINIYE